MNRTNPPDSPKPAEDPSPYTEGDPEDAKQRVRERTAALEAANLELKCFCYSVSHDLRAPLRSIEGWVQALLEDCGSSLNSRGREHLEQVRQEIGRMGTMIDRLLELSRAAGGELRREVVDLTALTRSVETELRRHEPDRRVEFVIGEHLKVVGDPILLRMALRNLLANAWKFTGRRPLARIEFGRATGLGGRTSDQSASESFFVRDDGEGFDPRYQRRLFGAFQRLHTDSEFPGVGVGLATVQRIIHRHGGQVWAESELGRGATFWFSVPRQGPEGEDEALHE